jgi:menaquinone-dependent protoporphyrinogen oxidase
MRVLVTYGSERGGTEGLAQMVTSGLREEGLTADLLPPGQIHSLDGYDAVIVGGALYANRWHKAARRFVKRYSKELKQIPVYFFASGPLDDSATQTDIPPVRGVKALMDRVGAQGHVTFGGRLASDAKGFPASAMAKKRAGDWRDAAQVRAWAHSVAAQLEAGVRQGM